MYIVCILAVISPMLFSIVVQIVQGKFILSFNKPTHIEHVPCFHVVRIEKLICVT